MRTADDVTRASDYLAGDDARRADEFNGYLRDPDVRAIVCARGGYGLLRILDDLDADALRADPKPIVAFSDGTALLAWAVAAAGVRPIHGPVVTQLGDLPDEDVRALCDLLERPEPPPALAGDGAIGAAADAEIDGWLAGGNLTLLAHLVGTRYAVDLRGAIALIEDVDEQPYAIDRYMTRIALARGWAGCRAVAAGTFERCGDSGAAAVVNERLRAFDLPGVAGLPIGHGARNRAVPIGARARLAPGRASLELLEGAVA